METKFQTSFIPKKPLITDSTKSINISSGGTSVIMIIGSILFILSLGSAIFSVVWKGILIKSQNSYKVQLAESEKRFNISLIEDLKKVNTKIDLSRQLFKKHLSVSEIFPIINQLTIETVRFNSFDFSAPSKENNEIKIAMKGTAKDYNSIAYQSDIFGSSKQFGKNKVIKNPIIADLSEDFSGGINFSFSGIIDSNDISYEKALSSTLESENK